MYRRGRSGVVTLQALLQQFLLCRRVVKTRHATSYSVYSTPPPSFSFSSEWENSFVRAIRGTLLLQSEAAITGIITWAVIIKIRLLSVWHQGPSLTHKKESVRRSEAERLSDE